MKQKNGVNVKDELPIIILGKIIKMAAITELITILERRYGLIGDTVR